MRNKRKILIIDDEDEILTVLKARLEHHHFECLTTTDASEGLRLAQSNQPHLIILDLNMPQISGLGILRMIKAHDKMSRIPVLVLSAFGDAEIVRGAMDLGACGYLIKTCDHQELMTMVHEYARADEGPEATQEISWS